MAEGVEGLLRDKTRKPGKPPLPPDPVQRVVELTLGPPPGEATHWTGRELAKAVGVSLRSVQRILEAHQLAPHRIRTFKLSKDPEFAAKLRDIVGLYVDPPAHAVVLSVDEKSQIQALDRTQPGLPMKKGRAGAMTHDYKRHGTTTLFAALNVLDGTVIGRNMQRHRHQEFIRFLNSLDAQVPLRKAVHAVVDNYATHKHPKVQKWLARHPRWTFHFTPTSASWFNAVEGFFAKLTTRRLKRGVFRSVADLQAAIKPLRLDRRPKTRPCCCQTREGKVRVDPLGRYYRHYRDLMAHWHAVLPRGRIMDVHYEELIGDLEGVARRIVSHCGLAWDVRCLNFHSTARPVRTASATQFRKPTYGGSVGRWRKFEAFLEPLLAELGPFAA